MFLGRFQDRNIQYSLDRSQTMKTNTGECPVQRSIHEQAGVAVLNK